MKMTNSYYKKNKEKLSKKAPERYKNLSEEGKDRKRQYALEWQKEENEKHQYGCNNISIS